MTSPTSSDSALLSRLIRELRHRHVPQVALIYVLVGLGVIEFLDIVFGVYGVAEGRDRLAIGLVLAGFPAAIGAAWFFEWNGGRVRARTARPGFPGLLVAAAGAVVVAGPLVGAVALNVRPPNSDAGAGSAMAEETLDASAALLIEIFEPAIWATESPAVLSIQEGTSTMMHGVARYAAGIERVLMDGERRMSVGLSDSARYASFSGFVDAEDEDGEVEIVVLAADGRYASRSFPVRKVSASSSANQLRGEAAFDRRVAAVVAGPAGDAGLDGTGTVRRMALIVGISDYRDHEIGDLAYAHADAQAIHDFLRSPAAGLGGFAEEDVVLLTDADATKQRVEQALSRLRTQADADDVVVLFFAGHGAPDPADSASLYLIAQDTRADAIATTGLSIRAINRVVQESDAYMKILLADVGHARATSEGEAAAPGPEGPYPPPSHSSAHKAGAFGEYLSSSNGGFVAFTAASVGQLPREGPQWGGGHGAFTYFLIEGLRGPADTDGDGVVTLIESIEYTRDRVRRATQNGQVPTISLTTYDRYWPMAAVLNGSHP